MSALISEVNQRSNTKQVASLVVLASPATELYCMKENITVAGVVLDYRLTCSAPMIKYSLVYFGGLHAEKEAESILSSLR